MLPVEILPVNESVVLRARGSELLILPGHVKELKGLKTPTDFTRYFMGEALINRPARKLFEAWLRKDNTLWPRLYKTIHEQIQLGNSAATDDAGGKVETKTDKAPTKKAETKEPAKAEKKAAPKSEKADKAEVKNTKKPEKKAEKAPEKKSETKTAPKKAEKAAKTEKVEKAASSKAKPKADTAKKTTKTAAKAPAKKSSKR